MITVIAWIVFVFATLWNILFWTIGAWITLKGETKNVKMKRTIVEMVFTLAIWFIPGVYLFGWF